MLILYDTRCARIEPVQSVVSVLKVFDFPRDKPGPNFRDVLLPFFIAENRNFAEFIAVFQAEFKIIPSRSQFPTLQFRTVNKYIDVWLTYAFQRRVDQWRDYFVIVVREFAYSL